MSALRGTVVKLFERVKKQEEISRRRDEET
jgi:hypothetical protein